MESFNGKMCPVSIDDADNAFDYEPEVSTTSSIVYGIEAFKEQAKESFLGGIQGATGGLLYKAGKTIDKYFPDGIKLFNGSVELKIGEQLKKGGDILVNAANRNLEAMEEEYKRKNPREAEARENIAFDVANQGANWISMLLAGTNAGLAMGGLILGGEFKERADKYKQEHGGSLEGFTEEYSDASMYNYANAYVQGVIEKYLGSWAQVKSVKKGWGYAKAIFKNAVQEGFIEEPLQDVTDFYFDKLDGFNKDAELKDRLKENIRGYVIASLFGGAGGFGAAVYQRASGIDAYKEALKDTVPEQDLENVATKAYEQDAKTMKDIVTVELENSSSLRTKRGEVFENMNNATIQAIKNAKALGAYSELETEDDIADYSKSVADDYADWVLEEANRRNTVIEQVLDESKIDFDENGLILPMTKGVTSKESTLYQEAKKKQFEIIQETNPHDDSLGEHTWIRSEDDIKTAQEVWGDGENITPDFTKEMAQQALNDGKVTVYSSKPIENGVFVTPSKMEAQNYAGGGEVYSKTVPLSDVAWIDGVEGQYAELPNEIKLYQESLDLANENARLDDLYPAYEGETININGQEKTVYNSNGDRIAKSEAALRNFYKWFGDSKVVDKQGRPLVVYHGTNKHFDSFLMQEIGLDFPEAAYFSSSEKTAETYTYRDIIYNVYLKMENPYIKDANNQTFDNYYNDMSADMRYALENDFDGVIIKNIKDDKNANDIADTYVAFNPNQIKSTSNRGTYSESENIYYQSAFAGSRVDYDRPSLEAIGSGEGNQAHGWGLYYALDRDVAEGYRERSYSQHKWAGVQSLDQEFDEIKVNGKPFLEVYDVDVSRDLMETLLYKPYGIIEEELENRINRWQDLLNNKEYQFKDYAKKKIEAYTKLKNDLYEYGSSLIKQDTGQVHEVDIPENPYLLDEQASYEEQPELVKKVFDQITKEFGIKTQGSLQVGNEQKEINGKYVYNHLADKLGSPRAASMWLSEHGIKGITYYGREDGRCFVIFNPKDIKVIQKFYQGEQGEKGSIQFEGDKALITLTERADSTTLPHELAHYYLQNTFLYTKSGLASPEYMENFKQIAKYLGITEDQETIKEWQQEKFARAYEMYQMGKAPEGMEIPLTKYQEWLRSAYGKMQQPMYRDENGEMKVPEFDYDTMKMFASLAGETLTEPQFKETQERVRGLAKTTSEMAKQKGIETETPMYEPRSSTEMGKKADEFIKENKQLAIDIVKGLAPEQDGLYRQDLFAALRELALNEGDSDLLNELSRSMTVEEATELGQRIQALARGRIDPVKQMTELRDERMKKEKVTKKEIKEETKKATKEIKKEIALAAQPKEWQDFIKSLEC